MRRTGLAGSAGIATYFAAATVKSGSGCDIDV
jgi:hypothetical protein